MWGANLSFQPICCGQTGEGDRWEGCVSWLLLAGLGIIWCAFLLPYGRRKVSPAATVQEFERKMDLLAETNGRGSGPRGRWVLMPRKDERFRGNRDRNRVRVRRRRRKILSFLVELTALSFLVGLFPPFRIAFKLTVVLGAATLLYVSLLAKLAIDERHRAERLRARLGTVEQRVDRRPVGAAAQGSVRRAVVTSEDLWTNGVRVIEDDVHVIIRRAEELLDTDEDDRTYQERESRAVSL